MLSASDEWFERVPRSLFEAWDAAEYLGGYWMIIRAWATAPRDYRIKRTTCTGVEHVVYGLGKMGEYHRRLEAALSRTGDEFIAVATDVYCYRCDVPHMEDDPVMQSAASAFEYLLDTAQIWLDSMRELVCSRWVHGPQLECPVHMEREESLALLQAEMERNGDKLDEIAYLFRIVDMVPPLERDGKLRAMLAQELCRAVDRRLITRRELPGDETPLSSEEVERSKRFRATAKVRLSESEQRIVDVIQQAGRRLTTSEIMGQLERQYGPTSEGTTKISLSHLVRFGFLTNRQDVEPKGYGMPEWD